MRAKKLRMEGQLDNYMMFANRALTAGANEAVLKQLAAGIGVKTANVHCVGTEALDVAFRREPMLAEHAGIDRLDGPLIVTSRELAEIVESIVRALDPEVVTGFAGQPVERTSLVAKNALNSMSYQMSERLMRSYSHLLRQISDFLANPENAKIRAIYDACAEDFDLKIIAHREEHQTFDKVFNHVVDMLVGRDSSLGRDRRLTRAVVFYMYWNCDIGLTNEIEDVVSEQA